MHFPADLPPEQGPLAASQALSAPWSNPGDAYRQFFDNDRKSTPWGRGGKEFIVTAAINRLPRDEKRRVCNEVLLRL